MTIVLKAGLAAMGLSLFVAQAQAISRYDSQSLTCGEAQAIVDAEGAAILRYQSDRNPGLTLFDRFVRHRGFCQSSEIAKTDWVPTADTPSCPVLVCQESDFDDDFFGLYDD